MAGCRLVPAVPASQPMGGRSTAGPLPGVSLRCPAAICLVTYFLRRRVRRRSCTRRSTASPTGRPRGTSPARGRRSRPRRRSPRGAGQRGLPAADPRRRAGRLQGPGARRRPDHPSRDERAHGRSGDVRRDAHPSGARDSVARCASLGAASSPATTSVRSAPRRAHPSRRVVRNQSGKSLWRRKTGHLDPTLQLGGGP
jgi:hypothetical protein